MQTKVIVVSETEGVVRIYVGVPEAKQMDQTGQFRTTVPNDPTALADMAIDMANHFGWLNGTPEVPAAARTKAVAVAAAPAKPLSEAQLAEREPVRCSVCKKALVRGSVERHMRSVHKWETAKARAAQRIAVVDETARAEIRPAPNAKARKASANDVWKQYVACPVDGCEAVMTRSNMTRHLMRDMDGHGMRHSEASSYVRTLPATNRRPAKGKPAPVQRANRQGIAGARILETEIFPAVLAYIRNHGEPVTSRDIADEFKTQTSTALAWLNKLMASGQVADVTQPPYVQGQARTFALVPETIGGTQEPAVTVSRMDDLQGVAGSGSIAST